MNNVVIKGEYSNHTISISDDTSNLVFQSSKNNMDLSKDMVSRYEVKYIGYKRNITDVVVRTILGFLFMVILGLLAGFTAIKSDIYYRVVYVEFNDEIKV
ncbi:hypothetical protein [Faecalimicrobium sp. JNUCC 81]